MSSPGKRVVVCGGGVAGAAAALAARRGGAEVVLLEKACLLGGLATIGVINYFVPMCNGRGRQVARGMADEFLRLAIRRGFDSLPEWWRPRFDGDATAPVPDNGGKAPPWLVSSFSAQIFALELTNLLHNEGVTMHFDELVCGVETDASGRIAAVLVEDKGGRRRFEGDVFIDATGDADLCFRAGAPVVCGRNFFSYFGRAITLESCARAVEAGDIRLAYEGCSGGNAALSGKNHPAGMKTFRGGDPDDLSEFLIANQLELLRKIAGDNRRSREITTLPTMPQLRTTRHLAGDAAFVSDGGGRRVEDSIAVIPDFEKPTDIYEVSWRTLVRTGFPNLVAVGRCASAEGRGWDVLRVIPPAILTGQAAGTAAALALDSGLPPDLPTMNIDALQQALEAAGSPVHADPSLLSAGPAAPSTELAACGQLTTE